MVKKSIQMEIYKKDYFVIIILLENEIIQKFQNV